ncbi:MAG: hypothetical protein AB7J40_03600 [Candidatus Altimarinota bacterium]
MKSFLIELNNFAPLLQLCSAIIIAIISGWFIGIYKESQLNNGDAALVVDSIFWKKPWTRNPQIFTVHKFEISDSEPSGYIDQGQFSGHHRWNTLVQIIECCSFFGFTKYKVAPTNPKDSLVVIISRNGKEKWRSIFFNKD